MKGCNSSSSGSQLPLISISIVMISLLSYLCADVSSFFQYDRNLIAAGELWRCIGGHLTHWSFDHFLWCSITFVVLGGICERLNLKGFIISLAASGVLIPAVSWFFDHNMLFYRGLSGICSSVFMLGSILVASNAYRDKDRLSLILPIVGGVLFLAKILYEFTTGHTVFVESTNLFSPVPIAHLVGGVVGLLTGIFIHFQSQKEFCRQTFPQDSIVQSSHGDVQKMYIAMASHDRTHRGVPSRIT